jgi:xanthine dehydrogenase molybdopterin-binding subunit B
MARAMNCECVAITLTRDRLPVPNWVLLRLGSLPERPDPRDRYCDFPNGCRACESEVDPDTGATRITQHPIDDVGRAINPMAVDAQIHGGLAQGIGPALMECVAMTLNSGQLKSGSIMDYVMPRAADPIDMPAAPFKVRQAIRTRCCAGSVSPLKGTTHTIALTPR